MWRVLVMCGTLLALLAGLTVLKPPNVVVQAVRIGLTESTDSATYDRIGPFHWADNGLKVATIDNYEDVLVFDFENAKKPSLQRLNRPYAGELSWSPDNRQLLVTVHGGGVLSGPDFFLVSEGRLHMRELRLKNSNLALSSAFWTGNQSLGVTYNDWTSSFTEDVPRYVLGSIDLGQGRVAKHARGASMGDLLWVDVESKERPRGSFRAQIRSAVLDRRYFFGIIDCVGADCVYPFVLLDREADLTITVSGDLTETASMEPQALIDDRFVPFYSYKTNLRNRARIEIFDLREKKMISSTYDYSEIVLSKDGRGVALTEAKRVKTDDGQSYLATQPRLARLVNGAVRLGDAMSFVDDENKPLIPEKLSLSPNGRTLIFRARGRDVIEYFKAELN